MKLLYSFYRINLLNFRIYIENFFVKCISYPAEIIMFWALWKAILTAMEKSAINFSINDILSYYVVVFLMFRLVNYKEITQDLEDQIITGNLASYFVRPIPYWTVVLGKTLASLTINLSMLLPCAIIILKIFCNVDLSTVNFFLFFIMVFFAVIIKFCLYFIIGLFAFYLERVWSLRLSVEFIIEFASGQLIPLFVFPMYLQKLFFFLPFQYLVYIPAQTFLNKINPQQFVNLILVQIIWAAIFIVLAIICWEKGRKKFTGYGI